VYVEGLSRRETLLAAGRRREGMPSRLIRKNMLSNLLMPSRCGKALEDENRRLKMLLAESILDNAALKDLLGKNV
jgi:hypothetical protein